MAGDLEIRGAKAAFVGMAKRLNEQGSSGKGLWKELNAEIKTAAEPMTNAMLRHLGAYLPDRYAAVLRGSFTVRVSRSTRGSSPGLKLIGTAKGRSKKRHISVINNGTLRKPVFGNSDVWVNQSVRPGFWTDTLTDTREAPATAIRRAVQRTISKID
jgi:hypothetical protein